MNTEFQIAIAALTAVGIAGLIVLSWWRRISLETLVMPDAPFMRAIVIVALALAVIGVALRSSVNAPIDTSIASSAAGALYFWMCLGYGMFRKVSGKTDASPRL